MQDLKKELFRKSFHAIIGIIFSLLIFYNVLGWIFFGILFIISLISMLYIYKIKDIPGISNLVKLMGRQNEFPGKGALTFMLGTALTAYFFPVNIAAASIMILAIGDSAAPIIDKFLGKRKHILSKHKKLEGFVAGTILSFLFASIFVNYTEAFFASLAAMIFEVWDMTSIIDDNILMPVIAGVVMTLI